MLLHGLHFVLLPDDEELHASSDSEKNVIITIGDIESVEPQEVDLHLSDNFDLCQWRL